MLKSTQSNQKENYTFFVLVFFFFFFEELKNLDKCQSMYRVTQNKTELELFCFIFVEVIKKFMGSIFLAGLPCTYVFTQPLNHR